MRTAPRSGRTWRRGLATEPPMCLPYRESSLPRSSSLFVLPIGTFRMLEIPQRPAALHGGKLREVGSRRRRLGGPFERPRIPRIAARGVALEIRPDEVAEEYERAQPLEDHSDRHQEIPRVPSAPGLVGVDAARHPEDSGHVHAVEREVEPD